MLTEILTKTVFLQKANISGVDYKLPIIIIGLCVAIIFSSPAAHSDSFEDTDINMVFNGRSVSANLQGVSLQLILEKLKQEKGISFTGNESLLEKKISIRFNDLPLESALRRILSRINHVFFYDRNKRLMGMLIFEEKTNGFKIPSPGSVEGENVSYSKYEAKGSNRRGLFELPGEPLFPSNNKFENLDTKLNENLSSEDNSQTASKYEEKGSNRRGLFELPAEPLFPSNNIFEN
jgi:hypothetical protein